MSRVLKIAAAQYPLDELANLSSYRAKISRWVEEAVGQHAELLVFPEYGSMELAAIGNRGRELHTSLEAVATLEHEIIDLHQALSRKHGVTIVAGSTPALRQEQRCNVAHIFGPSGQHDSYTKIMPTPWERDPWKITGGRQLKVFDIGKTKVGLLICYDIEFPLLARSLAEAGAEVIVVPSNTETLWGYWRVRTGCQARALENQVYTVHAPVVGPAPFIEACPDNQGMAGIFAPQDRGLPFDGVVALGELNKPQWVMASIDLELTAELRRSGGVKTFEHWSEQPGVAAVETAQLINWGGSA